jgi:hypothetical protein
VPEETPEQVMARLARYADTLRRSPGGPIEPGARQAIPRAGATTLPPRSALQALARRGPVPGPIVPPPSPSRPMPAAPTVPPPAASAYGPVPVIPAVPAANRFVFSVPRFADLRATIVGQGLTVAGCAIAVFAFLWLSSIAASAVVVAGLAVGALGIRRHWTFARWWTLGVLVGGLLGRFS